MSVYINENILFSAIKRLEKRGEIPCPNCKKEMDFSSIPYERWQCPDRRCKGTMPYNYEDWLAFLNYYNPNEKHSIATFSGWVFDLKYRNPLNTDRQKRFAEGMYKRIDQRIGINNIDFCVSIPNSDGRPNDVIGRVFAHISGLKYDHKMIIGQSRKSQKDAGKLIARRENVKGKFSLRDPQSVKGSKILVLDDIVTSGSSMDEVSKLVACESGIYTYAAAIGKTRRL